MLTHDECLRLFRYCADTGYLFWRVKHSRNVVIGRRAGTLNWHGYRQVKIGPKIYQEHRIIWLMVNGEWPKQEIDHINRVRNDNRIVNLREATKSQQAGNVPIPCRNTSGARGVWFDRRSGKWVAEIMNNRRKNVLGRFNKKSDAVACYKDAAIAFWGEFFPQNEAEHA